MAKESTELTGLLVIGYGSPLRGDDAAGVVLAEELEGAEGLVCVAVHQLTPELAATIASAAEVVFVDAVSDASSKLHITRPSASSESSGMHSVSHGCSPESLLDLARQLYGHCPNATVIGIPAKNFSLGEKISPIARAGIDAAKRWILKRRACHA